LALLGISPKIGAQQAPPSYAKDVKPFLARYCLECHNREKLRGGLNMETFKTLDQGGEDGAVFVAGKPDESRIVLQVEGKAKPRMPPQKAKQPKPNELARKTTRRHSGSAFRTLSRGRRPSLPSLLSPIGPTANSWRPAVTKKSF
jgi:hypothetical protein